MGLLNRLFGTPTPKAPPEKPATRPEKGTPPAPKAAVATAADTAAPAAGSSATAAAQPTVAKTAATPPVPTAPNIAAAPVAEDGTPAAAADEAAARAADEVTGTADTVNTTAAADVAAQPADETTTVTEASASAEAAADTPPVSPTDETATSDAAVAVAPVPTAEMPEISDHLQRRLDTYFARLRRDFPDGRITRLNTAHKKLAERGAELRRLIGYEGRLDEFFALGGFVYQRGVSGRPTLPVEQTDSVEARLRERFPEDVPTLLAVQQADHRLYLDLRAAARRAGCTVGDYLNQFRAD